jgi:hypothetical protein
VLKKREKRKIAKQPFTIEAFITGQKEIADITILPGAIAPALKKIIMKGFSNIQFNKPNAPDHIERIRYNYFKGEKVTITSNELLNSSHQ